MSSYLYKSTFGSKVLLFLSVLFIAITCNTLPVQPPTERKLDQFNQTIIKENERKGISSLKTISLPISSIQGGPNTTEKSTPPSGIIEGEAGGRNSIITLSPAVKPLTNKTGEEEAQDNKSHHVIGSRKGVDTPSKARKGAPSNEENNTAATVLQRTGSSNTELSPGRNMPVNVIENKENKQLKIDTTEQKKSEKPEYAYDDDSDSDKTSTNGEDYIIIGIVIVIGIWFSVFGALIFYRRAGEYWDRRHYRRMDFLVEGMYND